MIDECITKMQTLITLITFFVNCGFGANILYMDTLFSPSHHIWNSAIALELTSRGHNVTILTHHEKPSEVTNYTVISLEGNHITVVCFVIYRRCEKKDKFYAVHILQSVFFSE